MTKTQSLIKRCAVVREETAIDFQPVVPPELGDGRAVMVVVVDKDVLDRTQHGAL